MSKKKPLQASGDDFHLMVGTCIVAWAEVDDVLFSIFRRCVGPLRQCAIIYYRTPGLEVRLGLSDEIVRSVLPAKARENGGQDHPDVKTWIKAKDAFGKLLSVRRRIAHQPVQFTSGPTRGSYVGRSFVGRFYPSAQPWFEIYTNQNEKLRGRKGDKYPLRMEDLEAHLTSVTRLRDRLNRFAFDVLPKHIEEPPQPPPRQATARTTDRA